MSTTEITSKIENIKTLQTMIDELTAEMEAAKDEVKAEMTARGVDEMTVSLFVNKFYTPTFVPIFALHIFLVAQYGFFNIVNYGFVHKRTEKLNEFCFPTVYLAVDSVVLSSTA